MNLFFTRLSFIFFIKNVSYHIKINKVIKIAEKNNAVYYSMSITHIKYLRELESIFIEMFCIYFFSRRQSDREKKLLMYQQNHQTQMRSLSFFYILQERVDHIQYSQYRMRCIYFFSADGRVTENKLPMHQQNHQTQMRSLSFLYILQEILDHIHYSQ